MLGIFGLILGIFGHFGEFFSGILVYHYPPWPTLYFTQTRQQNLAETADKNTHRNAQYKIQFLKKQQQTKW